MGNLERTSEHYAELGYVVFGKALGRADVAYLAQHSPRPVDKNGRPIELAIPFLPGGVRTNLTRGS
jgi:hypothetical protein